MAKSYSDKTCGKKLIFDLDNSSLISQITEDLEMTANYNPDLEITSVNRTVPQLFDEAYNYDSRGNRLTDLTKTYMYDSLNKLIDSTTHLFGYDADGNLTLEKNKLTSETKKYYWDSENRLIKFEHQPTDISPVDITAEYKYDIYGRRIQKNVNGTVTNFMWEGDNLSLELDGANQPLRKYFTETGIDDYFGHLEYSEVTNWSKIFDYSYPQGLYGYIKDQVGTIYRVWDRNLKQYAETRNFDTFGNLVSHTGTTKTNLGFQGKYYDTKSGLNYFYHRYYSPLIGRFISEDPIGVEGGFNLYDFGNNPINLIDPYGFECRTYGEFSYSYSVGASFGNWDFNLRINPGGKIGIGFIGREVLITGSVIGNIKCKKTCIDECSEDNKTWNIPIRFSLTKKGIIGIGITMNWINYLYNYPRTVKTAIDTYSLLSDYKKSLDDMLNQIKKCQWLLKLICELSE